jgi:hypothetical protein
MVFSVDTAEENLDFFYHFNHREGNLKVPPLIKSGYSILPNPSTTLLFRLAKYNQLLRIEEELGANAKYAGENFRRPL